MGELAGRRPASADHRLTTLTRRWHFRMDPDGTHRVTTSSGVTRTTRPPGLHPVALTGDPPPF